VVDQRAHADGNDSAVAARVLAKTEPARLRPMITVIALASVGIGLIAWRFIFPIPALLSPVLAIVMGLALVTAG
jgi:hypothetical protein